MAATTVLKLPLEEVSAKVRIGPPVDDEEDYALPVWAGVLPFVPTAGVPIPDDRLPAQTKVPDYVAGYLRKRG